MLVKNDGFECLLSSLANFTPFLSSSSLCSATQNSYLTFVRPLKTFCTDIAIFQACFFKKKKIKNAFGLENYYKCLLYGSVLFVLLYFNSQYQDMTTLSQFCLILRAMYFSIFLCVDDFTVFMTLLFLETLGQYNNSKI